MREVTVCQTDACVQCEGLVFLQFVKVLNQQDNMLPLFVVDQLRESSHIVTNDILVQLHGLVSLLRVHGSKLLYLTVLGNRV